MLIVASGTWLRCWQATESLWLDELHTSWVVADSVQDIPQRARAGNQSPLYFYLVWGVVQLCGHTPWSLRLISLVSGVVLVALAAALVRRWSGVAASGLLAALLLAWNPDCIFYSQEARPYALLQLSALGHSAIFVALLARPTRKYRFLFVLGAAWLFYLHYTASLFLMAEVLCLIVLFSVRNIRVQYRPGQAACDVLCTALLLLPATRHVLVIAQRRENWARIVQAWPPPFSWQVAFVLGALVPLAAVCLGRWCRWKRGNFSLWSVPGIWAACWFMVPVLLAWLATSCNWAALFMMRYLVASGLGAIVFASLCHSVFSNPWYQASLACLLVAGTLGSGGMVEQFARDGRVLAERNEAWDEATLWLDQQLHRTPRPVFLCAGLLEDLALLERGEDSQLAEYCCFPLSGVYRIHAPHLESLATATGVRFTSRQRDIIGQYGSCWLIVRAGGKTTASIVTSLCQGLQQAGLRADVSHQRHFGTIVVLRIDAH